MKLWALSAAVIPALLGSTAVMAQDDTHPFFGLGANGGVAVLKLPAGQNGVLTQGDVQGAGSDPLMIGGTIGFNGVIGIGKVGDYDAFMGANLFATYANGSSTRTQNFSGVGLVAIPGIQTPANASINLTTSRAAGAVASVNVVDNNPEGGNATDGFTQTTPAPGNQQSASQVTAATGNSFVWGAANTQVSAGGVAKALAVGAAADTSGSLLLAVGDLDGLSIATSVQNTILYTGMDVTFGASGVVNDRTVAQAYIGPSYRFIDQWNKTNYSLSVDLPELAGTTVVHPLYTLDRNANVTSNYIGAVIGGSLASKVNDTVSVAFAAEGSLYYMHAALSGSDSVTIAGGSGVAGLPYGPQTVTYGPGASAFNNGIAYAIRGQASTTVALNPNMDLTLAASVDYLSKVARPNGGADVTYTANATDANASWSSPAKPLLSFGDMWAFTLTGGVTGHF